MQSLLESHTATKSQFDDFKTVSADLVSTEDGLKELLRRVCSHRGICPPSDALLHTSIDTPDESWSDLEQELKDMRQLTASQIDDGEAASKAFTATLGFLQPLEQCLQDGPRILVEGVNFGLLHAKLGAASLRFLRVYESEVVALSTTEQIQEQVVDFWKVCFSNIYATRITVPMVILLFALRFRERSRRSNPTNRLSTMISQRSDHFNKRRMKRHKSWKCGYTAWTLRLRCVFCLVGSTWNEIGQ